MRANILLSTGKSSKQTQHGSACLRSDGGEANAVAVVEEEKAVVVVSFFFKPSSLFSFVLHFVAFSSSSCCGGSGADVEVVVVVVDVVLVVVVVVCSFPSLASSSSSSSSSSSFGAGLFSAVAAAAASLNVLHSLRCPPFFQWCTWHSRPQYCTVWHNLQGFNGRNGVLGLPQVEQQRMVGVVRPSCLSNI